MAKPTDEILEHSYDGITEFNNPLPRWWVFLFILSILWSVIYMFYYHFSSIGDGSEAEYAKEMKAYELMMMAKGGGAFGDMKISKEDLTPISDKAVLASAKTIYIKNCTSCHGMNGEGSVGPNLTDDYWIHGNNLENIAVTIMNGVPEKGMISWKSLLKKNEIIQLSNFVKSLRGTNPPNPKPPQGNLVTEGL